MASRERLLVSGLGLAVFVLAVSMGSGCRRTEQPAPPMATPTVTLSHDRIAIGSPLEITYKFVVAPDAHFDGDYRVMAHVVDTDDEMMWTDDHNPPTPTSQWKPGETIQYTRTIFVPKFPYLGEASLQVGLYSTNTQKRLPLAGDDAGQRAYKVARIQLVPEAENLTTVFTEGWHAGEVADHNATVEWHWTKKDAVVAFKNPKKDCVLYLDVDNPGGIFHDTQKITLSVGSETVDTFTLAPGQQLLRKTPLTAAQMGTANNVEVKIDVDKTFVPALLNASASRDARELGIRVFHASVDPR